MNKVCSEWDVSIRRACAVLVVCKGTYHYKLRRAGQADLKKRIKEIAETRMRYGYRRVHVVLQREGWMINVKRTYRLYNELDLQLRNMEAQCADGQSEGSRPSCGKTVARLPCRMRRGPWTSCMTNSLSGTRSGF